MPTLDDVLRAVSSVTPPDFVYLVREQVAWWIRSSFLLEKEASGVHVCIGDRRYGGRCVEVAWWGEKVRARDGFCAGSVLAATLLDLDQACALADPERYMETLALPRWRDACLICGVELPRPGLGQITRPVRVVADAWAGPAHLMEVWWLGRVYAVLYGVTYAEMGPGDSMYTALGLRNIDEAVALVRAQRDGVDPKVLISLGR